jgi:hypothetical protein
MRRYNHYRVSYSQDLLAQARKQAPSREADCQIARRPGNPTLRYVGGATQAAHADVAVPTLNPESLELSFELTAAAGFERTAGDNSVATIFHRKAALSAVRRPGRRMDFT